MTDTNFKNSGISKLHELTIVSLITLTSIIFPLSSTLANSVGGPKNGNQSFLTIEDQKNSELNITPEIATVTMDATELANYKNKLDDQLFIAKKGERELSWPSFPRIWTERSAIQQRNINVGSTINADPFSIGIKFRRSLSNQYSLKTTFVMISSNKPNDAKIYDKENGEYPIIRTIFKTGADKLIYPNVEDNFPIVGFCSFEAKYVNELQNQKGISLLTLNADQENLESEPVSYYVTSKLFQINSKISIKHYLHSICGGLFKNKIEDKVMADFDKIKHEMEFIYELGKINLKTGLCQPTTSVSDLPSEFSDDSCADWHESNFSPTIGARTVARCEFDNYKKQHYCVLKSKENRTCPLYWDTKSKTYESNLAKTSKTSMSATAGYYEFPCDIKNDLQCEFESKPIFLLNVPLIKGRATCVRVSK